MRTTVFTALFTLLLLLPATGLRADIEGSYKVEAVVGPDMVRISFHGLPVTVRLANIKAGPEAQTSLESLVADQAVSIRFADELGLDASGTPYVNMAFGPAKARKIANIELVAMGAADYDVSQAGSKQYNDAFTAARDKARTAQLGIWAGTGGTTVAASETTETAAVAASAATGTQAGPASNSGVVAEMDAFFHHLPSCPDARRLSTRNTVRYASPEAAERAGKTPCLRCQLTRAEALRKAGHASPGRRPWPGRLIGLKSDPTYFYSPVAPRLKDADTDDMLGFETVEEAKATGRKPDPVSLRLAVIPGYPADPPEPGECIGRALPFFRPCRRAPADTSGLCLECQRGE